MRDRIFYIYLKYKLLYEYKFDIRRWKNKQE